MVRSSTLVRRAALAASAALVVVGCGRGDSVAAGCDDVTTEDLDPGWTVHLLPTAPEPDYLTEPPTSGAHYASEPASGVLEAPLDRPSQVTVLEVGGVLVQYRPDDLDESGRGRLERLAEDGVVVAPNPDLPDPVVATAWTTKQACEGVALDTLAAFIEEQGGQGPGVEG